MSFSLHCHEFPTARDQVLYFPCQQVCKQGIHFDSPYTGRGAFSLLGFLLLTFKQILVIVQITIFLTSGYFFPSWFFVLTVARESFGVGFFCCCLFHIFLVS